MKTIKRICAAVVSAAILTSVFAFSSSAATGPKNIVFRPLDDEGQQYLVTQNPATNNVEGQQIVFADGDSKIVWKFPLIKSEKVATLVCTVSQNYTLEISADGSTWTDRRADASLKNVGECSNGNKKEVAFDVSSYIPNGEVYLRLGDQTTGNGWGGVMWQIYLLYQKYEPKVYELYNKKTDFSFVPGSEMEKRFVPEGKWGGSLGSGGTFRFMDHTSKIVYRCPIDMSRQAWLNINLAANYIVKISLDDVIYKVIDRAEGGADAAGYGTENKGIRSYNITKLLKTSFPTSGSIDYFYVEIGDQTTDSGWGGQVHYFGLHYGKDAGLYNPFETKGIKNTLVRYRTPQKILTYKKIWVKQPKNNTPTNDLPLDNASFGDSVSSEEVISIEQPSSQLTSIGGYEEQISSSSQTTGNEASDNQEGNNVLWYIVIGAIAIILIGGIVTQFVLMEKKRKNADSTGTEGSDGE